jgi:mycothiol synthase
MKAEMGAETDVKTKVRIRPWAGSDDLPHIVRISNAAAETDGISERTNLEQMAIEMRATERMNPDGDLVLAEADGSAGAAVVGFGRASWIDTTDGLREYRSWCEVDPAWRRRGVGSALWAANQRRIREIAAGQPDTGPKVVGAFAAERDLGAHALLQREGMQAVRWFFHMVRPLADPIVDMPMPDGLEIRPVTRADARQVFEADVEAFMDHWGGMDRSDELFQKWMDDPDFDPNLWVIAFDGDEIAGASINTIYADSNRQLGLLQGWLDSVFTRRPWRGRGLARALVARSLTLLKERGMTEAILGVDADNPTGAMGVYTDNGFVVTEKFTAYRRPLDGNR